MNVYRVTFILLGTYDVTLAVEAENIEDATNQAIIEMKNDCIYREGKTIVASVDQLI